MQLWSRLVDSLFFPGLEQELGIRSDKRSRKKLELCHKEIVFPPEKVDTLEDFLPDMSKLEHVKPVDPTVKCDHRETWLVMKDWGAGRALL